jgi:4-amino-4-deoxy-L-arabinose transferase-like glycosyltransferase
MQTKNNVTSYVHILAALALSLGIRSYLWLKFPHVIMLHEADGIGYISIARAIVENFSLSNSTHFPPFYPALIAVVSLVVGNYETGARVTSILMGSCMVIPFYLACRHLMSARASFCAILFSAFFGSFVDYSLQPLSQSTYSCLIATGVWLGLSAIASPARPTLACFGAVSAAIYLTRPEGVMFYAVNLPVLFYVLISSQPETKERLKNCALLLLSFSVPFIWYTANLKRYTGHWTISGKSAVTSIGIDASLKLLPGGITYADSVSGTAGITSMFSSLSGLMRIYMAQLGKFTVLVYETLPGVMLVIFCLGIILLLCGPFGHGKTEGLRRVCLTWVFLSPLAMIAPVMAFDKIAVSTGYILPFFMIACGCCAKGLECLEGLVQKIGSILDAVPTAVLQRIPLALAACLAISWVTLTPLLRSLASDEFRLISGQQEYLLRQTGHWIRSHTGSSSVIMSRYSNIGYYADRTWAGLVDGSVEEVTDYARQHGVTHIVIDSDTVPRRRPGLKRLLDPASDHPGLAAIHADQQFDTRVVIYRVN